MLVAKRFVKQHRIVAPQPNPPTLRSVLGLDLLGRSKTCVWFDFSSAEVIVIGRFPRIAVS